MNDLKFAVRQLLKNPGFTAVAVLTLARRRPLLSPKNAPHLPVINTHLDDEIPATAPDVVARTIANPPANPVGAGMFRGREQTLLEFDAFSSSAVIGGGNRPGERHSQFVLQNGFIQSLRHDAFRSGLRQYSLGLAKFNDVTGWRDKVKERGRNNKLARIMGRLQIRVVAHRAFVRFARFLHVVRTGVRVRVKRDNDFQTLRSAPRMRRDIDGIAGPSWPPNHLQLPCWVPSDESSLLVSIRRSWVRLAPSQSQRGANIRVIEKGFDARHESECCKAKKERLQVRGVTTAFWTAAGSGAPRRFLRPASRPSGEFHLRSATAIQDAAAPSDPTEHEQRTTDHEP